MTDLLAPPPSSAPGSDDPVAEHEFVIVGSGFAGLGAAIRLRQEGFDDLVVLERGQDVGGTWRDNSYPGCACDVPSNVYSFSFAQNPGWTRNFSRQPEIFAYLREVAAEHGVYSRTRFGTEVTAARWDGDAQRWDVETTGGRFRARYLIAGTGPLSAPKYPDLPGLETFQGAKFHSAEWDHEHDLTGKRVAVIGTGASAIQFVPHVQRQAAQLTLFQRTAPWIMPRADGPRPAWQNRLFEKAPITQKVTREAVYLARELMVLGFRHPALMRRVQKVAEVHLKRQVPDAELRRKLTPDYTLGCKRVLISNDYYPAVNQANVDVVDAGIAEVRERSIVDRAGVEHPVDTIIYGTGFKVTDQPVADWVVGEGGRSLAETWAGSPRSYKGTTFAGFPNLFLLVGPNTGLGHNSIVFIIESQLQYVIDGLKHARAKGWGAFAPRPEAQRQFSAKMDELLDGTVWTAGGCASWYLDAEGRASTLWPTTTITFKRMLQRFDPAAYLAQPVRSAAPAAS